MKPRFSRTLLRVFHLGFNSLPFPRAALVLTALKHKSPTLPRTHESSKAPGASGDSGVAKSSLQSLRDKSEGVSLPRGWENNSLGFSPPSLPLSLSLRNSVGLSSQAWLLPPLYLLLPALLPSFELCWA